MNSTTAEGPVSAPSLADTVHDLRTPLTSILATLELLKLGSVSAAESRELIEGATAAALHLDYLIGDILDDAALDAGRLRLVRGAHRVADLLDELRRVVRLAASDRGIRLALPSVDIGVRVHTDDRRFLQVALNLVGNALKFAPRGGTVAIELEESASCIRFAVVDDGPGV
ncbi:MAG: HAMP domain-containing histidine kinase, partial [Planctomycetes bacterium]|nr:HAMP domain-containing histidine kinase [Planctomycetota bacterium]